MSFESESRRDGVDLEYEHAMQEQSERQSQNLSEPFDDAETAPVSPHRLLKDMDESLACIDLEYEHEMQIKHCSWIEGGQGHFLHRRWVLLANSNDEVLLRVDANNGPTCIGVHTHVRNIHDEACVHDQHPFLAMIYLLRNAEASSTVYVSVPFLTDMHIVDELCHYAKPVSAGGRDLKIRVILGPQRWVTSELQRFVNAFSQEGSQLREEAIGRLAIRRFGTDNGAQSSYCHSKAMVSTAGAMTGSYNFTYASRYRHREDGCYMPPGTDVESLRNRLHDIWDAGEPVVIRRLRPPPGYVHAPSKKTRIEE
eukprot:scaffold34935_cov189-Amphora_coffeaeformis.AAC.5